MGTYTELILKCSIKKDIPDEVVSVLNFLFNGASLDETKAIPLHQFFNLSNWMCIGNCSSYYHIPFASSKFTKEDGKEFFGSYLFSRSDLKNYGGEIAQFLDWINEYIAEEVGHCIGWTWYEEDKEPTLIFKK